MRIPVWRLSLRVLGLLILAASIVWLVLQPGFEPLVGFLTALVSLLGSFAPGEGVGFPGQMGFIDQHNRQTLLNHVRSFWVDGVLKSSLHGAALIDLGMEERPDVVATPWEMVLQLPNRERHPLPPGTQVTDVFEDRGRSLLILGAPGSGKTTTLLQLARDTINRAEQDTSEPIPVVFNLSAWGDGKQDIKGWLVDELNAKYQVPRRMGSAWLDQNQLLLLMDGLDEVRTDLQPACVDAINRFCAEQGLTALAICSRISDYESLNNRLQLRAASLLQPLTPEQIDAYLERGGEKLAGVRQALRDDPSLQELAQTPLMLSIMTLAYQGLPVESFPVLGLEERRRHLFDAYVQRMFKRRGADQRYPTDHVLRWLSWMARQMSTQAETMFLIERLQPGWLDTPGLRRSYAVLTRVIGGLATGAAAGLLGFVLQTLAMLPLLGTRGAFVLGGQAGVIISLGCLVGGAVLVGQNAHRSIQTVESLRWSWARAWNGLFLGLAGGLVGGLVGWLFEGSVAAIIGPITGLSFGISLGLGSGLSSMQIETRSTPNQGIRHSVRNALIIGAGSALLIGLVGGLAVGLVAGGGSTWKTGLIIGLIVGIGGGLIVGTFEALIYGGRAAIRHLILRGILARSGRLPWRLVEFFDYATDRIFLRKVGGGYIFVHRLLQDYFSGLEPGDTHPER